MKALFTLTITHKEISAVTGAGTGGGNDSMAKDTLSEVSFSLSCIVMYLAHLQSKGKVENLVRVSLLWQCVS